MKNVLILTVIALLLGVKTASAAVLPVSDYSGPNGEFPFLDNSYPGTHPDGYEPLTGGVGDLTDGISSTNFSDSTWVGWPQHHFSSSNPLTHVFNLGQVATINSVLIDICNDTGSGINTPASIVLSFSDTVGGPFTNAFTYTTTVADKDAAYETLTINLTGRSGQYVQVQGYHATYGSNNFIFGAVLGD